MLESFLDWLYNFLPGAQIATIFISMLPLVELRGAIPFGVAVGLSPSDTFLAAVIGNMLPVPFIILFMRHIFRWLIRRGGIIGRLVKKLEARVHDKSAMVIKYRSIGLCLLVAVPIPGTGAWTGAMVAAVLDMPLKVSIPIIFLGVVIAGLIVTAITCGIITIF
jgi:uncharacterized membrane protein